MKPILKIKDWKEAKTTQFEILIKSGKEIEKVQRISDGKEFFKGQSFTTYIQAEGTSNITLMKFLKDQIHVFVSLEIPHTSTIHYLGFCPINELEQRINREFGPRALQILERNTQ